MNAISKTVRDFLKNGQNFLKRFRRDLSKTFFIVFQKFLVVFEINALEDDLQKSQRVPLLLSVDQVCVLAHIGYVKITLAYNGLMGFATNPM